MKRCDCCGYNNEESAVNCAGCGEPLRPQPAQAALDLTNPALDPVILATFENTEHASLLKARLEAAGIEAWTPEDFSIEFPPQTVSVQVSAKDAPAAGAIAAEFRRSTEEPARPQGQGSDSSQTNFFSGDAAAGKVPGTRACVSCGAAIPYDAVLCPKCGWTQPQIV